MRLVHGAWSACCLLCLALWSRSSEATELVPSEGHGTSAFEADADSDHGSLPEPMLYDLVRGLHARAGELEVNAVITMLPGPKPIVRYAPEVEYAFADGFAGELEIPLENDTVEAIKAALQVTAGKGAMWAHGLQLLGEGLLHEPKIKASLTHVAQVRFDQHWTLTTISGTQATGDYDAGRLSGSLILNGTVGFVVNPHLVLATEANLELSSERELLMRLTPQVHVQMTEHVRLQFGVGAEGSLSWSDADPIETLQIVPLIGQRLIVEL